MSPQPSAGLGARSESASPVPFAACWIAAARFERDRRAEEYPQLIADGQRDEEKATLDYQAWCAIVEFLEQHKTSLIGSWGGTADPPVNVISWQLLEESCAKTLAHLEKRLAKLSDGSSGSGGADDPAATRDHHTHLSCIHSILVKQCMIAEATDRMIAGLRAAPKAKAA